MKLGEYLDLRRPLHNRRVWRSADGQTSPPFQTAKHTFPQWLVLFVGVAIQPYFDGYKQTHHWHWSGFWGYSLFALITSLIIFPAVYRRAFDPQSPILVQLAPIFTAGIGWQALLGTALAAATAAITNSPVAGK